LKEEITKEIDESIETKRKLKLQTSLILEIAENVADSIKNGGKTIFFGNGGSAADSQHIAAEFIGKFQKKRRPFYAIALTTNTSTLTSIGNDFGFDEIFVRQIQAICSEKDVVFGISTSGNSKNIINAINEANKKGALTVALTGKDGGVLAKIAKKVVKVPSNNTQRIQEAHILIGHLLVGTVEKILR